MRHVPCETRSATPIEVRNDGDDPIVAATQAVDELRTAVEQHRSATDRRITTELRSITERLDAIDVWTQRPGSGTETASAEATKQRQAFRTYLRLGNAAGEVALRALTVSTDPQGGYVAPPDISAEFIRDLVEFSPIRSLATVRQIASPSVKYPRRTGVTNAQWEGETDDQSESTVPFGQVDIPQYLDVRGHQQPAARRRAGVAESEVRPALAEDFGKRRLAFISGSGPLQPEGLMTASGVGYTPTGNASMLGSAPADLLITHYYSLPATYRARGTWLMNGSTLAAIRKLKDGTTGVYLWQPSYAAGQPESLLGRPIREVPDMDDVGSGAEPIAFGDVATAYRVVDRLDMSILVNPYLLATRGIVRIHATRRVGAAVVQRLPSRKSAAQFPEERRHA